MYRILSCSKDTYITNKILNNTFRATDANVGQAGTLDLFKLSGETKLTGSSDSQVELSRLLIKFDLNPITSMQNSGKIDINSSNFKCFLKLHDVYGGQTTPFNYHTIVFPLSQSFDEGHGYDVTTFNDIGSTNFITASSTRSTTYAWNLPGAMKSGSLGDENIDVIVSGALKGPAGTATVSLSPVTYFNNGEEDLLVDVTKIVSGVYSNQIPDHGFLIAFSGSYEKDVSTYFVKRFGSRNSFNTAIRPKLIVKYDDSIHDYHEDFIFDVTSSLYLNNHHYNNLANIAAPPGSSSPTLTGANCMILKIESGSFKKTYNVSQALRGINRLTGIYSSSFAISSFETTLRDEIMASGSVTFSEVWSNSAETITFLSSSLTINAVQRSSFENFHQNLLVTVTNLRASYGPNDVIKIRVFSENRDRTIKSKKLPYEKKSQSFHEMYYRVRDFQTDDILIDFDTTYNSTRLSTDSNGMYFEFYLSSLPRGRTYVFDFLIKKNGFDTIITDAASKFRIN
jgi:hypothetical protein